MLSQEHIAQFRSLFNLSSVQLKLFLQQKQNEIEQQTGERPSMQQLFEQVRSNINETLGLASEKRSGIFSSELPGIRINEVFGLFIPDIPLLATIPNWHSGYWPESFTDKERTDAIKLYCDPRFQRLSYTFPGRLSIIATNESITDAELREKVDLPVDLFSFSNFCHSGTEEEWSAVLNKLHDAYGEKYGIAWIVANEPPTGRSLLQPKWVSSMAAIELWWNNVRHMIAMEHRTPALINYPAGMIERKMNWMYSLPKFKKLSSTIHGRMDIICRIELFSREQMAEELDLDLEILDHSELHAEQIVQHLIGRFGDDYGAVWLALGLGGLERAFAWQVLKDDHAFLRRVPALFRKAGRLYISYAAANGERSGAEMAGRECKNCSGPLKGRIDKQFCCGACQRIYYYHQQNREALNGIDVDDDDVQEAAEEPREKSGLTEFLQGPLGQIATGAIKAFVDRGVNRLGDELFGVGKDTDARKE